MKLVLETIHGNSKVSNLGGWGWGRQITVMPASYGEGREHFTELYNFFTGSLGAGVDIQTLETLHPQPQSKWCYQIEPKYGQNRFFIKNAKDLDWFRLKYNDKLTRWSR